MDQIEMSDTGDSSAANNNMDNGKGPATTYDMEKDPAASNMENGPAANDDTGNSLTANDDHVPSKKAMSDELSNTNDKNSTSNNMDGYENEKMKDADTDQTTNIDHVTARNGDVMMSETKDKDIHPLDNNKMVDHSSPSSFNQDTTDPAGSEKLNSKANDTTTISDDITTTSDDITIKMDDIRTNINNVNSQPDEDESTFFNSNHIQVNENTSKHSSNLNLGSRDDNSKTNLSSRDDNSKTNLGSRDDTSKTNSNLSVDNGTVHTKDSTDPNGMSNGKGGSNEAVFDSTETLKSVTFKPVSFCRLFRFATGLDGILMILGTLGALVLGCAVQMNFLIFGRVLDLMIESGAGSNATNTTFMVPNATSLVPIIILDEIHSNIKWFAIIGAVVILFGFMEMAFWTLTSERQTKKMREKAFWSILNKHQGWFDQQQVGDLTSMLVDDIQSVQTGISDKLAKSIEWLVVFVAGLVIGFVRGWKLTLVVLAIVPLLATAIAVLTRVLRKLSVDEIRAYGGAGAIAEEVLSSIRTVAAYGGEEKEIKRYSANLETAQKAGKKKGFIGGILQGVIWVLIFGSSGLAFWFGTKLVGDGEYNGGEVMQIFFGILLGTMSIGHAVPYLETLATARVAAAKVFDLIDEDSEIDSSSSEGDRPSQVNGTIKFNSVRFSYPTRKSLPVLNNLSFTVSVGQMVALVGSSGSGKSTVVQLIQRFYDPDQGEVMLDDRNIKDLNVQWLRRQVGVVSQEPILFATTIGENIRLGNLKATQAEIEKAAKEGNAHDFIMALPKKYETLIGERGSQLSGGQKQRIAIARALVSNPKILLLDEATSALDMQSESVVQQALDKARQGRTTIVIAHRLSTIKNADSIISLKDGRVLERGTHTELMVLEGQYYQLVTSQRKLAREYSVDSIDVSEFISVDDLELDKKPSFERSRSFHRLESSMSFHRTASGRASGREKVLYRSMSVMSEREEDKVAENLPAPSMKRILRLNASETPKLIGGSIGAVFVGASQPVFSVIMSEVLKNFASGDISAMMEQSVFLSAMFVVIGLICGLGVFAQNAFFSVAGENLTLKLRNMSFAAMVRQDMGWYDDHTNQVGALTARLANDTSRIRGAAGQQFGLVVQAIANMGVAIIIAFIFGPKLAGVIFVFIPLMFFTGIMQGKMVADSTKGSMDDLDQASQVASEAIDNIRTVAALTKEQHFEQQYNGKLKNIYWKAKKNAMVFGISYAISQSIIYFAYAATFGYGNVLLRKGEIEFYNVFRVFSCLIFGSMSLGRALSWMPDYTKAKAAAAKILHLLDREPKVRNLDIGGLTPAKCRGEVSLHNVTFSYPMRPDVNVLSGLALTVSPGQTVALVGTSGCGKSTTVQLLERFYDPDQGCLCIDGQNLISLNMSWVRSQIGLVSQEPVLFDLSIKNNIAYGDNTREVTMEEIIEAAKQANIHNFISSLPDGYDTNVGEKGTQLSGGQKQRVAIARALIRKPKILLLDEATSALDTESEKIVQQALDQAREGRTCIVIAHRLSTIENADSIIIIHNGQAMEQGSHQELMDKQGFYYELQRAQSKRKYPKIKKQTNIESIHM